MEAVVRRPARADFGAGGGSDKARLSSLGRFNGLGLVAVSATSGPSEDSEGVAREALSRFGVPASRTGSLATTPSVGAMSTQSILGRPAELCTADLFTKVSSLCYSEGSIASRVSDREGARRGRAPRLIGSEGRNASCGWNVARAEISALVMDLSSVGNPKP